MQALAVIEAHDVVSHVVDGLLMIGIITPPNTLHLQVEKEPFHHGIIPTIPLSAHTAYQTVTAKHVSVFLAGILAAPVGMDDQAGCRLALANRHLQSHAHQLGRHAGRHRPADDLTRIQVQYGGQIQPAAPRADIGDIRHPSLIGRRRRKSAIQYVVEYRQVVLAVGGVNEFPLPYRLELMGTHRPRTR